MRRRRPEQGRPSREISLETRTRVTVMEKFWYCGSSDHLKKDCPKHEADRKEKQGQARSTNTESNKKDKSKEEEKQEGEDPSFFNQNGQARMALVHKSRRKSKAPTVCQVLTDSCCDTTFLGGVWYVTSQASLRSITMTGFNGSSEECENLPIV